MRISSVVGIAGLGALFGATAILVPLGPAVPGSTGAMVAGFLAAVSQRAAPVARDTSAPPASAAVETSTIEHLTTAASAIGKSTPKVKVSETPWAAQVAVVPDAAAPRLTSSRVTTDEQRVRLARELQVELKRVGCYDGNIDGDWRASSREAMAAFNDRVNASLPYDEPDYILLTLVQGHRGRACGNACPSGEETNASGRCIPSAVQTHAHSRPKPGPGATVAAATAAGAVAAAARTTPPAPVPVPAARHASKVAATPAPVVEPVSPAGPATVASSEPAIRNAAPLPGRMSIGGPIAPPLSGDASAPVTTPIDADVPTQRTGAKHKSPEREGEPPVAARKPDATAHRPSPPPPAPAYQAPRADKATRQRRLVYEMFQNPNRN